MINEVAIPLVPRNRLIAFFLVFLLVGGCNYPSAPSATTVDLVATAVTGTLTAEALAMPNLVADLLPHPLYFLSESSGSFQVWKLERDGVTQSQITNESFPVDNFDVSPLDGSVAYISNNQLYLVNAGGSNRRLLVDKSSADLSAEEYFFLERISDPSFSPNGRTLAYALNGLWILDLSSNQAIQLLTNELDTQNEASPTALYTPLFWAPNNEKLLVSSAEPDGGRLSILNLASQDLTDFDDSNSVPCCQVAWTPDSSSILLGSPYLGLIEPGLWRYDAETGEQTKLLGVSNEGVFQFVGWPLQLADGSLRYFYTSSTEVPANDLPLFMVRSDGDGQTNRVQLRPDSFSNISEVLWAEDGSLALILQLNPTDASGTVVLAFSDGRQLQILVPRARDLKWGQ